MKSYVVSKLVARSCEQDKVQIFREGHKSFGPSSTYNLMLLSNVKKIVEEIGQIFVALSECLNLGALERNLQIRSWVSSKTLMNFDAQVLK